jgi:hypothetical protein
MFEKGRKFPSARQTESRASRARAHILVVKDILPSPQLLSAISTFERLPIDFWTAGLQIEVGWDNESMLRRVYQRNRRNNMVNMIYRAFDTTTTYLLIKKICAAFNADILSPTVLKYYVKMIMNQGGNKEERDIVKGTLKQDFQARKRWHTYTTELGGYGAFFLIRVAPSWM